MKHLLKLTQALCLVFMLFGCTSDSAVDENALEVTDSQLNQNCVDQDPITRVINNGTVTFDLKVFDAQGTVLVDFPNIPANTTTSWASFEQGEVMFSLNCDQALVNDDKVVLQMDTCMAYEIEIDGNNEIVSYVPTIL